MPTPPEEQLTNGNSSLLHNEEEWRALRDLLLSPEQGDLRRLRHEIARLENDLRKLPKHDWQSVSRVLPAAVAARTERQDDELPEAMQTVFEDGLQLSVNRNPHRIADTLTPIFGLTLGKAVIAGLRKTARSLNATIEQTLSPQSFGWRLEALRTRRSFADVVLLKTLQYRVEQVFLIHINTGTLLAQAKSDAAPLNAETSAALLTAIQDFVRDSQRGGAPSGALDHFHTGDFSIWIERGSHALIAGVIRGSAPYTLRENFAKTVRWIHLEYRQALQNFAGDAAPFERASGKLHGCLQSQLREDYGAARGQKRRFTPLRVIAAIGLIAALVSGFFWTRDYWRWSNYLARLKSESGVVVTEATRGWLRHSVTGLRDLSAVNPPDLLGEYNLSPDAVDSRWENYYALTPQIIEQRAKQVLQPPETVKLQFDNQILRAAGTASPAWVKAARSRAFTIIGVAGYDDSGLNKSERTELTDLSDAIAAQAVFFNNNSVQIAFTENEKIDRLAASLENLFDKAAAADKKFRLRLVGRSETGNDAAAERGLNQQRAAVLQSALLSQSTKLQERKINNPAIFLIASDEAQMPQSCVVIIVDWQ